jgi:hypothetical protein
MTDYYVPRERYSIYVCNMNFVDREKRRKKKEEREEKNIFHSR